MLRYLVKREHSARKGISNRLELRFDTVHDALMYIRKNSVDGDMFSLIDTKRKKVRRYERRGARLYVQGIRGAKSDRIIHDEEIL